LFTLAGRVADKQERDRSPDDLLACLRKLRAGRPGSCDWCWAFRLLLRDEPSADNLRLVDRFHHHEQQVYDLIFERDTWRAILRVAQAFYVNGRLDSGEITYLLWRTSGMSDRIPLRQNIRSLWGDSDEVGCLALPTGPAPGAHRFACQAVVLAHPIRQEHVVPPVPTQLR
jgi:hypothetical protein